MTNDSASIKNCSRCSKNIDNEETNYCPTCGENIARKPKGFFQALKSINKKLELFLPALMIINSIMVILLAIVVFGTQANALQNVKFIQEGVKAVRNTHDNVEEISEKITSVDDRLTDIEDSLRESGRY